MWLEAMGLHRMKPAGMLRFSHYDQLIQAALDGQGVALGVSPLVRRHVSQRRLVLPFQRRIASPRAYHLITARRAIGRPDVAAFSSWLLRNASQETD
jgi:DNA-binding transcriptional LysR family regulator